jgi:DNA-binding transcriptional regulator GbsR (MarR family)
MQDFLLFFFKEKKKTEIDREKSYYKEIREGKQESKAQTECTHFA